MAMAMPVSSSTGDWICSGCGKLIKKNEYHQCNQDGINHPLHYNSHPTGIECITIVEHMTFNLGNATKYIWRAGQKGDTIEDLKKARWYIDREIQRLEKSHG